MKQAHSEREALSQMSAEPRVTSCMLISSKCPCLYDMRDVTGIDFALQAVLVCQTFTPEILQDACKEIEVKNLSTFTLVCMHATHRSVACAVLLAMLAYPNALIRFSTKRTQQAAVERGMIQHQSATGSGRWC